MKKEEEAKGTPSPEEKERKRKKAQAKAVLKYLNQHADEDERLEDALAELE